MSVSCCGWLADLEEEVSFKVPSVSGFFRRGGGGGGQASVNGLFLNKLFCSTWSMLGWLLEHAGMASTLANPGPHFFDRCMQHLCSTRIMYIYADVPLSFL